ncbi:MAG: GntR family transcriptional regulator [Rhodospirillales bacterium]
MRKKSTALEIGESGERKALYARIAEVLEQRIRDGELQAGDQLPSQSEIMADYGVSQATARQAILNLTNQGLVIARQGKGVFVAEPRIDLLLSSPEVSVEGKPGVVAYDFVSCDLLFAPERMAALLEVETGANITRCRRRLVVNKRVIGMETSNLPLDVMQGIGKDALYHDDLRQVLCRSPEWQARTTSLRVSAGVITEFDAELMEVSPDRIVIQCEEVTRGDSARPLLMTRTVYLADLVSLTGSTTLLAGAR